MRARLLELAAIAIAGCASPHVSVDESAATVAELEDVGCSTEVVIGLSQQIVDEVGCMVPGSLARFGGEGLAIVGGAVLPYLDEDARADLEAAGSAAAASGGALEITSAYRTVAQQYLLRRWFERGRCDITAAAEPGASNHESGRAIDVRNHGMWMDVLPAYGWVQTVPGDDVHFDHVASADNRGADVLAFQRLWNRNRAGDTIDEDGLYGPETAARLAAAPAAGFALAADCGGEGGDDDSGGDGDDDGDGRGVDDVDQRGVAIGGCRAGADTRLGAALLVALITARRRRARPA